MLDGKPVSPYSDSSRRVQNSTSRFEMIIAPLVSTGDSK